MHHFACAVIFKVQLLVVVHHLIHHYYIAVPESLSALHRHSATDSLLSFIKKGTKQKQKNKKQESTIHVNNVKAQIHPNVKHFFSFLRPRHRLPERLLQSGRDFIEILSRNKFSSENTNNQRIPLRLSAQRTPHSPSASPDNRSWWMPVYVKGNKEFITIHPNECKEVCACVCGE